MVQWNNPEENKNASNYFRINQHRLQLANIGLEIIKKDGTVFKVEDVKNIRQTLNMWTGEIHSQFTVDDVPVEVITYADQDKDAIGVKINSPLMQEGKISIRIRLPYPTGNWADMGNNFTDSNKHVSSVEQKKNLILFGHILDSTEYFIGFKCSSQANIKTVQQHYYLIAPVATREFEFG